MTKTKITLRPVSPDDLVVFFLNQMDWEANQMAAFTARDPKDRAAFDAHWEKIMGDDNIIIRTIVWDNRVAGHVLSYVPEDTPEVSYWLGRQYWGRGIATGALDQFLTTANTIRPIYARVAKDNIASLRVLQKCGFKVYDTFRSYANARGQEIEELALVLN